MKNLRYLIIFLFFDFIISNLILKKTNYWNIIEWNEKYWRIPSEIYHHGLLPNINEEEKWGGKITKELLLIQLGLSTKKIG